MFLDNISDVITSSAFIGSIAIFTDYLSQTKKSLLGGDTEGKAWILSRKIACVLVSSIYIAVIIIWVNLGLAILIG